MSKDWYTKNEVAEKLGISLGTVYHWAKQGKLSKIEDPNTNIREARYLKEEVDALHGKLQENRPDGIRPSSLARQLKVPVSKVYNIIRENNLPVNEFPIGDERTGISIPEELIETIHNELKKSLPKRGTSAEFFNYHYDIALFQRFTTPNGQDIRVMRNEKSDWGFYHQSRTFIPYTTGISEYRYIPTYLIHQKNIAVKGYVDFILPKDSNESFDLLDFAYEHWGVENVRLREQDLYIEFSIKSGVRQVSAPLPESLSLATIEKYIHAGKVQVDGEEWTLVSGSQNFMLDLPEDLMKLLRKAAKRENISMSGYVESVLDEKLR